MNTQDNNPEVEAPGIMLPSTGSVPPPPEFAVGTAAIPMADEVDIEAGVAKAITEKPTTPFGDSVKRLGRDVRAMTSLGLILLFIIIAVLGPILYQHIGAPYTSIINGKVEASSYHNFTFQELNDLYQGPSARHWLGTDGIGRDTLARLMQGMLVSLLVAVLVEIVDIVLGITFGVLAGYYGGWIDQVLARFTDVMFAFPGLLFVILLTGILGGQADVVFSHIPIVGPNGNARLLLVSFALSFTVWPLMARYVRGQALQLKQQQFIEAARTSGTSNMKIILRHIIPNLFSIVVIASTLNIANTIISEAGISLLGLGVQAPGSSIGLMISDGTELLDTKPLQVIIPVIALAFIVLAFSFLGDGLRDAFDPRSKE